MTNDSLILTMTAFSIGFVHTILGPDHYVPFVAMSKARNWTILKTLTITATCGAGHVAGSVVLGLFGLALGTMVIHIESLEAMRGEIAGWLLIGFGLTYFAWGLLQASRHTPNGHGHRHGDIAAATVRARSPSPQGQRVPANLTEPATGDRPGMSWMLFMIFILGPCEPLVPLLIYPAATAATSFDCVLTITLVVIAFGLATIATMIACVVCMRIGLHRTRFDGFARFGHAFAGLAILVCGLFVKAGF
jgi:hypothetical protein